MSPNLPAAILDTVLGRLAILFLAGAGGDFTAAREAASQMLAAYHPGTPDQLRLAAEIISFSFHALEALGQAADPAVSLNRQLRLRGSAVSLSRASHKAQRKLDQLQKAGAPTEPVEHFTPMAEPVRPRIDNAIALVEATRNAVPKTGKHGGQTWTQAYQQRQRTKRIAENLKGNQATAGQRDPTAIPALALGAAG